jgi:hypothetical protein
MTDKPKRGMAALLAEQQEQVAAEPARPARDAGEASPASPSSPARRPPPAPSSRGARASAAAARPAITDSPSRPARDAGPGKAARLRSWYMTPATAGTLAQAVDDLHYATRAPKYEVLAAIIRHALADLGPVEAELRAWMAAGE